MVESMPSLTKRSVDALLPGEGDYFIWDDSLPGFGVRVWSSGKKVFIAQYRVGRRTKRLKIGNYGALTVEEARKEAKSALGEVARGGDPQLERSTRRSSITVAELCDDYLRDAEHGLVLGKRGRAKKGSTLSTDRGRIKGHVKPLLGNQLVKDLSPADVARFIRDVTLGKTARTEETGRLRGKSIVRGGPGTASRTVGLLGSIMTYAVMAGIIPRSPTAGVKRPPGQRLRRRLSPAEYSKLGRTLIEAEAQGEPAQAVLAINLLALTGCRKGEIERLRWSEVDASNSALRLQDSKEGYSVRPVGEPGLNVLKQVPRLAGHEFVFTSPRRSSASYGGLPGAWERIQERAGLSGVTMHTLRHSYASVAADLGYAESTIAALLGHAQHSITSGYVHHLDSVLIAAADRVARTVQRMMQGMSFEQASSAEL